MKRAPRAKSFLTAFAMLAFFAAALWSVAPLGAYGSGGQDQGSGKAVVIKSPADNAVIRGSSVDVIFELRNKGKRGDHVHLYLDGRLVKPLHGRKVTYTINQLRRGNHVILIRLATKGHKILEPQDSVTIEVR